MTRKQQIVFSDPHTDYVSGDDEVNDNQAVKAFNTIITPKNNEQGKPSSTEMKVELSDNAIKTIAEKVLEENDDIKEKIKKQEAEKKEEEKQRIEDIMENPPRLIYQVKAVFPFDFFPDELRVEENRVNIISKTFFFTSQLHAMSFKDIKNVEVQTSIFFAKIRIATFTMVDNFLEVNFLRKHEALKARCIIEGLRMLTEQGIDFSKISIDDLLGQIEQLGSIK